MAPAAKTAQTVMTLDPRTLVVNPELRARKFGPAPEAVADMAYSMITTGQDTPISVRNVAAKGADPQWCVVSGYTRTEAAILIREGFTHNDEEFKQPRFVIKALEAPKMDDAEALVKAIIENHVRNETSVIDEAHNMSHLIAIGKSQAEVADIMGVDAATVSRYLKLTKLSDEEQLYVHLGQVPYLVALDMLKLSAEDRAEVLRDQVKAVTGKMPKKLAGAVVSKAVRAKLAAAVDEADEAEEAEETEVEETEDAPVAKPKAEKPKAKAKTISEVKQFLTNFECGAELRELLDTLVSWIAGGMGDRKFAKTLAQYDSTEEEAA